MTIIEGEERKKKKEEAHVCMFRWAKLNGMSGGSVLCLLPIEGNVQFCSCY